MDFNVLERRDLAEKLVVGIRIYRDLDLVKR